MTVEPSKHLEVVYFAALREQRGLDEESVDTTASTVAQLYGQLKHEHEFSFELQELRVAVNDVLTDFEAALSDRDRITFLPPIAGG